VKLVSWKTWPSKPMVPQYGGSVWKPTNTGSVPLLKETWTVPEPFATSWAPTRWSPPVTPSPSSW